ncbi:hypothetical protein RSOLAG22IIIB_10005 [Rhizoctonia solani]|uniref:F-box domain-containing protein n=1 Tax=Rhizoctonia solani TaxID=456999 RepID=A0A0K6G0I5_9AGAM|nr:hypothetical protein RSOLAG22IIIB_10005 [Rhizoctonia solani]
MSSLTLLPSESLVHILRLLPPADIKTCKLLSRQLLTTIQESPELQYLLELDLLGLALPLNPLDTLPLGDKIRVLQHKRFIAADPTRRDTGPQTIKFEPIGSLSANIQYSRGVLAVGKPSIDVTRQLQLYQLASSNKHTPYSSFLLADTGVEAHDFRFDPDLDLLVLLERVTLPADTNADLEMRFHLKSLGSGLAHPLASNPVLRSTFKFTTTYSETGFQIVGKLLIILGYTNSRLDISSPKILIWDWTTGDLITSTEVPGTDFAFISEDTFLIPVSRPTSLPPAPLVIDGRAIVTTPKRIYEPGPGSHYLGLHVKAFNIEDIPNDMANGILFVPSLNIHLALKKMATAQSHSPVHIEWEDWARGASWANTRQLRRSPNCIFGHRAAFLSFDSEKRGWKASLYDLRANVRGPTTDGPSKDSPEELPPSDGFLNAIFINPKLDVRGPAVIASFMVYENESLDAHTDSISPELVIDDERIMTCDEERLRTSPELSVYDV